MTIPACGRSGPCARRGQAVPAIIVSARRIPVTAPALELGVPCWKNPAPRNCKRCCGDAGHGPKDDTARGLSPDCARRAKLAAKGRESDEPAWPCPWRALLTAPALAGEAGDLVFAERGPWDLSCGAGRPGRSTSRPRGRGLPAPGSGHDHAEPGHRPRRRQAALQLDEATPRITCKIGPFPISAGNPSLTFFLESVARDMAALTGGSRSISATG